MRFRTWVLAGLTGAFVVALPGAPAISAGALPAGLYPANAPAPGKGAPPLFGAGARSSHTLPAGLYPAKALAPGKGAPLLVPAGIRSSNSAARAHALDCYPVQGFKSVANDRYVAAELRNTLVPYGLLRASATHVGPWEEHQFCHQRGTDYWSIFTNANQRWAITQINYRGPKVYQNMLRADARSIGPWERYQILCIAETHGSFVIWSPVARRFVAAELAYKGDDYGTLRARASKVGPWEIFRPGPGCNY
jgi:hypothetical protein